MKNQYGIELNIIYDQNLPYLERSNNMYDVLFNINGKLYLNLASENIYLGNRKIIPKCIYNKRMKDFNNIIEQFKQCKINNFRDYVSL